EGVLGGRGWWLLLAQGEYVEVGRRLHRGVLVEVVRDEGGFVVGLDLDDDAHPVAIALVADVGDTGKLLVLHEIGDLLDERRLVHRVGQLGDDDRVAIPTELLVVRLRPGDDPAAALRVGPAYRVDT